MFYEIALVIAGAGLYLSDPSSAFGLESRSYGAIPKLLHNTTEIVANHGYPVETHVVTTEDGYLLTLHRIPGSPKATGQGTKTPVFLQHGLSVSSDIWVLAGPDRGLGFLLADQGYDVWMGNARGNFYSREHVTLIPEDSAFWNFTWHEMGVYDLPAVIDYISATTKQPQLFYVGHSMGTVMFFVLTSVRPDYNARIRLMVAMAPAVYAGQQGSFSDTISRFLLWQGGNELQRRTPSADKLWTFLCKDGVLQPICSFLYFNVYGYNRKELNSTLLPLYMTRLQSGTSAKTMEHFTQIFEIERFQLYDEDAKMRGFTSRMAKYDLNLVSAPVAIYYGQNDAIIRPKGVFRLRAELPNVVKLTRVPDDDFNHVDFQLARNVKTLVYDDVITLFRKY